MLGYKAFTPQWTAILGKGGASAPYQYEVGHCYEETEKPLVRRNGFHFCKELLNCLSFYETDVHTRIALVDAYGDISDDGVVFATNKIKIVKEIPWREVLTICEEQINGGKM